MQYLGLIRHVAVQLYCHAVQHPQLLIRLCLNRQKTDTNKEDTKMMGNRLTGGSRAGQAWRQGWPPGRPGTAAGAAWTGQARQQQRLEQQPA